MTGTANRPSAEPDSPEERTPGSGPSRIADDPVQPTAEPVDAIIVDGEPVPLRAGETIAACLLASGRVALRTTRFGGRPRGLFCGIGVCFDCLVTVNGTPGVRACRHTARPGDQVQTGPAEPPEPAPVNPAPARPTPNGAQQ
jgi:hypothetical protein